jgi:UPF0755 protein
MRKKKKGGILKKIAILLVLAILAGGAYIFTLYKKVYDNNVSLKKGEETYFYIKSSDAYNDVLQSLSKGGFIENMETLEWVFEQKNYKNFIKAGRYKITAGMSNNALADLLRSGEQEALQLKLSGARSVNQLAGQFSAILEQDSTEFLAVFTTDSVISKYGFNEYSFFSLFLPNTYEVLWNTSPEAILARFAREYKVFWNTDRKQKAKNIGLSQTEVSTLASIVTLETAKKDEEPKVAGVYMNRVNRGMLLQADPTLIFALNDLSIKRVLNVYKKIESPYNTYKYKGLPPGPICVPRLSTIDAVLSYEKHKYLYFCAKEDFSGYHNFATSYTGHLINARKYQRELNRQKVYK